MEKRQLPEDFKDFIKFLNSNDVEYFYHEPARIRLRGISHQDH